MFDPTLKKKKKKKKIPIDLDALDNSSSTQAVDLQEDSEPTKESRVADNKTVEDGKLNIILHLCGRTCSILQVLLLSP